jgi:hypothetical protein
MKHTARRFHICPLWFTAQSTDVALVYDTLERDRTAGLLMSKTFSSRTPRRPSPICQTRCYGDEHKNYCLLSFDVRVVW